MSAPKGKVDVPRGPEHFRFDPGTEVAGPAAERLYRGSHILRRGCWAILLLRYALGHI